VQGCLCPLRTKAGAEKIDFQELHVRGGEFVAGEVEDLMDEERLVHSACAEVVEQTRERRSVLIFSSGVKHGAHIVRHLQQAHGVECGFVTGETPGSERDALLDRFRAGDLKYLCNVNVLTTGFDAPNVDCVALVRPTMSPGLYYQMVGRGFRLHPGKCDCLVLDFGGNILRHGPVDQIRVSDRNTSGSGEAPAKECPECRALIHAAYARCPECGHEFPPPERSKHDARASDAGILSGGEVTTTVHPVQDVYYCVHVKRDAEEGAPRTMRVDYRLGFSHYQSEWVCFEHPKIGYAYQKAMQWWMARTNHPMPEDSEEAVDLANDGVLAPTISITVRHIAGERFDRIVGYELGEKPAREQAGPILADEDIPF